MSKIISTAGNDLWADKEVGKSTKKLLSMIKSDFHFEFAVHLEGSNATKFINFA